MNTLNRRKVAVDSEAERYWSEYYKDSGYGELWTRTIPKKVKAELTRSLGKTASKDLISNPEIRPLTTVITNNQVHLEGLIYLGSGATRRVKAFVVDFDHKGNVQGFDSVDVDVE